MDRLKVLSLEKFWFRLLLMHKILICVILFLSLLFRLKGITQVSFWHDELWTIAYWCHPNSLSEVWLNLWNPYEANLPLYPFFINIWSHIFGISELALVLPSAIAGSLSVVSIYLLAKKCYTDFEAIISASFMCALSTPLYFSQEIRCYSFVLLLTTVSLFFKYSEKKTAWITSSILLCWTHYFGVLFVLLMAVLDFANRWFKAKPYFIIALSMVPLLPLIWFQFNHGPVIYPDLSIVEILSFPFWIFDSSFQSLAIVMSILLVASILTYTIKRKWKKTDGEFYYLVFAPVLITVFVHFIFKPVFQERYLLIALPAAFLLVSHLLSILSLESKKASVILASLILVSPFWGKGEFEKKYPKIKESLEYISQHQECDKNIFVPEKDQRLWAYYLTRFSSFKMARNPHSFGKESFWTLVVDITDEDVALERQNFVQNYEVLNARSALEVEAVCLKPLNS